MLLAILMRTTDLEDSEVIKHLKKALVDSRVDADRGDYPYAYGKVVGSMRVAIRMLGGDPDLL